MDPQRIPAPYWRDRLAKARAMGLNTVFSYVYWNLLEPNPGCGKTTEEGAGISAESATTSARSSASRRKKG